MKKNIVCVGIVALALLGAAWYMKTPLEMDTNQESTLRIAEVANLLETYEMLEGMDLPNPVSKYDLALAIEGYNLQDEPSVPVEGLCQAIELNDSYTYYSCEYPYLDTIHIKNENFSYASPVAVTDNSIDMWYVKDTGMSNVMTPDFNL
jgi:hypothetical protein